MARVELFFGGSAATTPRAFADFLARQVTPRFPDGLSLFEGYGQWRDSQGHSSREQTRLMLIYYRPDKDADYEGPGTATHCSAFAAAVGQKVGVYLLRPPEHGQVELAHAQPIWFHSDQARQAGWRAVEGAKQAQILANQGNLVVISPYLAELRATLRTRMKNSALMDAPRFARNVEDAYRSMWRAWCHGKGCASHDER